LASVALLAWGVHEPPTPQAAPKASPFTREALRQLGSGFWAVVALGACFTLARFSEAFLVLRAQQTGMPLALVPLVMVAMNIVYALAAYPFGKLSDRMSHRHLLGWGVAVLVLADAVLASSTHWAWVLGGVLLWGLHLGITQGLLAAMVADVAPAHLRGTAFGVFNLASGLAMLLASTLAGWLWGHWGPGTTFAAGALFCGLTAALLAWMPGAQVTRLPS
jgi:MFS family permease